MKKTTLFIKGLTIFLFGMMLVFACEGPAGADGEQGLAGENGVDGVDGMDGANANAFCADCHNLEYRTEIKNAYALSVHAEGANVGYAGGRNACAKCHSHQGFHETLITGRDTTAANIPIPVAFNCETCHGFHATLDSTEFPDYALNQTEPVVMMITQGTETLDLPGSGNLCAYCHQPRHRDGFPLDPANTSTTHAITTTHWGPHHGPQSVIFMGEYGFEVSGSMSYPDEWKHQTKDCAWCHMADAVTADHGGHTFTPDVAKCNSCHGDAVDVAGLQTEIEGLVASLSTKLQSFNLVDAEGHIIKSADGKGADWTNDEAGVVFNYLIIEEDRSHGMHNYPYVKALLQNSIEKVDSWSK